ncbi:MAG: hypothetical protein K2W94_01745 [Alphaproteobacteria bacterium]|nr:hypothetical protein [Alphaproteobacteria bacterium]
MAEKRFGKILIAASVLAGFSITEAYSMEAGFSDSGLFFLGQAIQRKFQEKNDNTDNQDYRTNEPISPFALSSPSLSDDFMGEKEEAD